MSAHYSEERQRKILTTLQCPSCGEQNVANAKAMIELDDKGLAYCNKCGLAWVVDEKEKP